MSTGQRGVSDAELFADDSHNGVKGEEGTAGHAVLSPEAADGPADQEEDDAFEQCLVQLGGMASGKDGVEPLPEEVDETIVSVLPPRAEVGGGNVGWVGGDVGCDDLFDVGELDRAVVVQLSVLLQEDVAEVAMINVIEKVADLLGGEVLPVLSNVGGNGVLHLHESGAVTSTVPLVGA